MKSFFVNFFAIIFCFIMIFSVVKIDDFFYPFKYKNEINSVCGKYGVNQYVVASMINIESRYCVSSISDKGAVGLMQLMPETAEWLSKKLKINYEYDELFDAEYNINLGCYYFSYLKNYFDNEEIAICAYNAGMGNVSKWITEGIFEGNFLNKIPFEETRNYLKKYRKNVEHYKNKYNLM